MPKLVAHDDGWYHAKFIKRYGIEPPTQESFARFKRTFNIHITVHDRINLRRRGLTNQIKSSERRYMQQLTQEAIEKRNQQEFEKRVQAFIEEFKAICHKHKVDVVPQFAYTPNGILPQIGFAEYKEEANANT